MKFLSENMEGRELMPIHVYYTRGDYKCEDDDILDFVYKDLETGKKYVETIRHPYYEVWIVKPQYRNYRHLPNFKKKELCDCYRVHYKTRYKEIAKIMGINEKDVKTNPYILQLDITIEHFYLMQFKHEYATKGLMKPDIGFLDIESDMFQSTGKIQIGADPINCISYLDGKTKTMYTFILRKDNIPHVPATNKKYPIYEEMRKKYYEQVDDFIANIDDFLKELHEKFDASYGHIDYHIMVFEEEIKLIGACLNVIRECSPDFWFVWNLPYDEDSILHRIEYYGYDLNHVIPDPEMQGYGRNVFFKPDNNPKAHKRKHISNLFTKSIPYDQLPLYAGIRVAKGSLQSMKLNQIAKIELNDEKLDYSEYGDFKYFNYQNFRLFIMYNIKDVLLQYGIESKVNDGLFLMDVLANDCVLNYEIFTTTTTEEMAIRDFAFYECGQIVGNNKNKMDLPPASFSVQCINPDDNTEFDFMYGEEDDDEEESDGKDKKKDKYPGAYVMSPAHISPSGTMIMGKENKYAHKHVIDEDIGSEYPSVVIITNCTNDTFVGKVFLLDPSTVKMPFHKNFYIVDAKDEETYQKIESSPWIMELWAERDVLCFGETVLNLPSANDILTDVESIIDTLK